jgi:hypothetical protein
MGDPQSPDPDLHFNVNFQTGAGDVRHTPIPWMAAVPKVSRAQASLPRRLLAARHGRLRPRARRARGEVRARGDRAREHGRARARAGARSGQQILLGTLLEGACLGPAATAMFASRAIDLNGDGVPESGGLIWSAHLMHTRDGMRQSVLDGVQLNRIFKGFDGHTKSGQAYNADGNADAMTSRATSTATGRSTSAGRR